MEFIKTAIDWLLHLDKHLVDLVNWAGPWSYAVFFLIIFCETGLVVTPFLPGDSLLFAAGALAALGSHELAPWPLAFFMFLGAVIGDSTNYWIGRGVGSKVFERDHRFIKRAHLEKTQKFYEKYGAKTIVLARFVPIVRTFAPFVAGVGVMNYKKFLLFSVVGSIAWVGIGVGAGVMFGNLEWVKSHFSAVVLIIIVISILPMVIEFWRARRGGGAVT